MPGVREPFGRWKPHSATGRTDDEHVADVAASERRQSEIGEQLQASGSDQIATCLVTGERRFVDQRHPYPTFSQHSGGDTPRRAAPDNENVKARPAHPAPFARSDLQ